MENGTEIMRRHLIDAGASVMEAMGALNNLSGETMTLFVVDDADRLLGSLTDGDVRRALLSGHSLSDRVESVCHRDCVCLDRSNRPARSLAPARKKGIMLLPVVENGRVVSLIDLRQSRGFVPVDAVLMAGGSGERLRPLTANTPKPLLPVGGKPIIDRNIELLRSFGISDITVSVNYLKEQLISHLPDDIHILEEPRKLGTIGALSLLPFSGHKGDDAACGHANLLVMNADLLTDINLEAMYMKHLDTQAWLTMAVVPYSVSVPFAIIEHRGDNVTGLTEKPTFNHYANAGIYILRREAAAEIPYNEYFDAPDLINKLIREGHRVSYYIIEGRWLDIGSPDDYRHACESGSSVSGA